MQIWKFLAYSALGTAIWNTILIYLGAIAGNNWQKITGYLNTYSYVIGIAVSFVLTFLIIRRVMRKKAREKKAMALRLMVSNDEDNQ